MTAAVPLDRPGLVLGLSRNLHGLDSDPRLFARHPGRLVNDGGAVPLDLSLGRWIVEGELAMVLGAEAHRLDEDAAAHAIGGWTIADDATALDRVTADGYSQEGKGSATAIRGWVTPGFDADHAHIEVLVNGESAAAGEMARLKMRGARLLAWVSQTQHLLPGDVILCGAPGTAAPAQPGDEITIVVPGLGELSHSLV